MHKQEIDEMLQQGISRSIKSSYSAPLWIVYKKSEVNESNGET